MVAAHQQLKDAALKEMDCSFKTQDLQINRQVKVKILHQ